MPCLYILLILFLIGLIGIATEYVTENWPIVLAVVGALTALLIAWNRYQEAQHQREMAKSEAERRRRNIERFDRMVLSCPKCGGVARAAPRTVAIYMCAKCGHRLEGPKHDIEEIPRSEL